jgi:hypothetical protein
MNTLATEVEALELLLEPLRECLTVEVANRILQLRAPPDIQAKLDLFAMKHAEGTISSEELAEYDSLVRAGNLIAVIQAKARSVVDPEA